MSINQIIINSFLRAGQLAIVAVGLTMAFKILKFANFAHVSLVSLGAFLVYTLYITLGINLVFSVFLACILTALIAILMDQIVFKRMREASDVTPMIASLGLSILKEH